MLTLATCNTFSGGTEILEGSILAAREGALGSGSIRMADGTQLYINYPFANDWTAPTAIRQFPMTFR